MLSAISNFKCNPNCNLIFTAIGGSLRSQILRLIKASNLLNVYFRFLPFSTATEEGLSLCTPHADRLEAEAVCYQDLPGEGGWILTCFLLSPPAMLLLLLLLSAGGSSPLSILHS